MELNNEYQNFEEGDDKSTGDFCHPCSFQSIIGGVVALPVILPLNVTSVLFIQTRLVAALTCLGQHRLSDKRIRALTGPCLCGKAAKALLQDLTLHTTSRWTTTIMQQVAEQTLACLTLLNQPWFRAVRGNHEQMMLDCLLYSGNEAHWMMNEDDEYEYDYLNVHITLVNGGPVISLSVESDVAANEETCKIGQLNAFFETLDCESETTERYMITDEDGEDAFIRISSIAMVWVALDAQDPVKDDEE